MQKQQPLPLTKAQLKTLRLQAIADLDAAGPGRAEARWRLVENPWPWALDAGVDRYGLWADFAIDNVRQRLRWIAPGGFWMGSPESEPERWEDETRHRVRLTRGYWLADTACTQALWQAVTGQNPAHFHGDPQCPVESVSWDDCQGFIAAANERLEAGPRLRLPAEAEWEYACRAGSEGPFSWGDSLDSGRANYDARYPYAGGTMGEYRRTRTVPVLSFEPNPWGLYQMHGNVWEWCADWLTDYPEGPVEDPAGSSGGPGRVLRGGGWGSSGRFLRAADRYAYSPDFRGDAFGLRLAGG